MTAISNKEGGVKMNGRWKKIKRETGQAMVEFALVLPILLLTIIGCMEIAWYFTAKYNLNQYTEAVGHNIKAPFMLVWYHDVSPTTWIVESSGRKPSWLSAEEQALWSFDEYDGWYALAPPESGKLFSVEYSYLTFDNETLFKKRLQEIVTMINPDEVQYTISGGWYINAEVIHVPGKQASWTAPRKGEKIEYYSADVRVDMTYRYEPLTMLGQWMFCHDGEDYVTMKVDGRYVYNLDPGINT